MAAPEAERALFERPAEFRKMKVRLGDAFTIHGASYVRPPIQPIPLDRAFKTDDMFTWRGREFACLDTRGNSPAACRTCSKQGGGWLAFSGDVMLDGAKMHTWFDTEWDYGFAAGIHALRQIAWPGWRATDSELLLPVARPGRAPTADRSLRTISRKLEHLEKLYVRGYDVEARLASPTRTRYPGRPSCRTSGRSRPTCSSSSGRTSGPTSD